MYILWFVSFVFTILSVFVESQGLGSTERDENTLIWCTVNNEEQHKCENIAEYLKTNVVYDNYGRRSNIFSLNCSQTFNKDQCMVKLDNNEVDVTTLDPGEVFVGGRYHSLVPIMEEIYNVDGSGINARIHAVAVLEKSSTIQSLRDLRGKRACFGGVGTLAGWVIPINRLMKEEGGMEIIDCNNHVKSALEFFGESCAVNSLSDKYNPLGDNSDKLCEICGSDLPGVKCTSNDPYSGYEGALNCLMDKGEIAFLKHATINEYFSSKSNVHSVNYDGGSSSPRSNVFDPFSTTTRRSNGFPFDNDNRGNSSLPFGQRNDFGGQRGGFDNQGRSFNGDRNFNGVDRDEDRRSSDVYDRITPRKGPRTLSQFKEKYELLCPDGTRTSIDDWRRCYWDELPAHAVVTSSAKSQALRLKYQRFLQNVVRLFTDRQNQNVPISLFESYRNRSNLMFQDATVSLRSIPEKDQTYTNYLGDNLKAILEIRACPVSRMTLCVTSEAEMVKCIKMRTALNAQLLKPEMSCYKAHSHINCMESIRNRDADAAVFDAGDVYTAGYRYNLIPVLAEIYNLREPEYYAVAVAYQGDPDTELTYLKGKTSCHSGIGHAAGWIVPMAYLISSGRMRNYGCDSVNAAAQYFTKSCVPGALSKEYNFGEQHNNLCDLCRGSSFSYCSRDASEDFYGATGAFRCLIEGGGQVAFVKHTTVNEVTDGKRREFWARNTLRGDYELLCRDGTRAPVEDYRRCNLGKVKANAVVIRGGTQQNDTQTKAIINLFLYAQQFYGRKFEDDFSFGMFYSPPPYSDLIFQDAAQQLEVIAPEERNYRDYLGKNFLKARALVDCRAGGSKIQISNTVHVILPLIVTFIVSFR